MSRSLKKVPKIKKDSSLKAKTGKRPLRWMTIVAVVVVCALTVPFVFKAYGRQTYQPREYCRWVMNPEHGLRVKKAIGTTEYTVQYKPSEFVALMQDKSDTIAKSIVDKRVEEMKGLQYYTFTITTEGGGEIMRDNMSGENDYYDKLDYMVSHMQNDFTLIDGRDTLPCVLYHFERNYNTAPFNNFLLAFEWPQSGNQFGDKTIVFEDKLLGNGIIKLTVSGKDLEKIPNLQFLR